jgi:hypothetical protein
MTELIIALAGAFLGAVGIRIADALRANLQLRTARLDALEASQKKLEADALALGQQGNTLVQGIYAHDRELARIAFKLNIKRDDSPLSDADYVGKKG